MSQRVLIGIESNADWGRLKKELLSLGADSVSEPRAIQPDLSVATVLLPKTSTPFCCEPGNCQACAMPSWIPGNSPCEQHQDRRTAVGRLPGSRGEPISEVSCRRSIVAPMPARPTNNPGTRFAPCNPQVHSR